MCGILGYVFYKNKVVLEEQFKRSLDKMIHRGPDDYGIYSGEQFIFGHRRLSILDTSIDGKQPMADNTDSIVLTYNGEIYNYKELKQRLLKKGYTFKSKTDTEVLLCSYIEWGVDCIYKIEGIFAFAIWDKRNERLFIAKDKMGVKPLFYHHSDSKFVFSSEIEPILDFHSDRKIDPYALDSFFTFSYIPAPMSIYSSIKQLEPANYLVYEKGKINIKKYWDVDFSKKNSNISENEMIEELDFLLDKVIRKQSVSDVDIGAFLSGGVDSFALCRAMNRCNIATNAYTIGFSDNKFDELEFAGMSAKALDMPLKYKILDQNSNNSLIDVQSHSRELFADSSSIPFYELCKFASKDIKVVLSGDGADELFGGYDTYIANRYVDVLNMLPRSVIDYAIKPASALFSEFGGKYSYKEKIMRLLLGAKNGKNSHSYWRTIFTDEVKREMYTKEFLEEIEGFDPYAQYNTKLKYAREQNQSDLNAALYADMSFYLPNDMLVKADRMGMANSLEVRVPFLDIEMVNFAWSLPDNMKINKKIKKYIVRKVIEKDYPKDLQKLPKSGFNVSPMKYIFSQKYTGNKFLNSTNKNKAYSVYHEFLIKYNRYIFEKSIMNK